MHRMLQIAQQKAIGVPAFNKKIESILNEHGFSTSQQPVAGRITGNDIMMQAQQNIMALDNACTSAATYPEQAKASEAAGVPMVAKQDKGLCR